MIREATEADIPELLSFAETFHQQSPYAEIIPFCGQDVGSVARDLIANDDGALIRSDNGLIAGVITPHFMNRNYRIACELMWWSSGRSGLKLLKAFEGWALHRGASIITAARLNDENAELLDKIYERRGYSVADLNYWKALQWQG